MPRSSRIFLGKEHPAAAVALHAKVVEDLFGILAGLLAALELFIRR